MSGVNGDKGGPGSAGSSDQPPIAGTLRAGWGAVDFTPGESTALAGYTHWSDRMSTRVRDPLMVRALALQDGDVGVLVVAWDLLMVTEDLYQGLRTRLADTGFQVFAHATHTHSSIGGFWDSWLARRFLGTYRPGALLHLLDAAERAARAALADLAPAQARASSAVLPGLNGNRRDPAGPKDEELTVLRLHRADSDAVMVSYSAHPVIVAERDHLAMSADFPGEVIRKLQQDFPFAMFIQGVLGAVDVLFPDDKALSADRNLELMAGPLAASAASLARSAAPTGGRLQWAADEWDLGSPDSRPFFEDEGWRPRVDLPLRAVANYLVRDVQPRGRVEGFRLGTFALLGFQADLGVSIGLAAKAHARERGALHPVAASQVNGYIGYLHLGQEYRVAPPESHLGMARYENAMNFFGRGTGDRVLEAARTVLDRMG